MIVLPTERNEIKSVDPQSLLIYSLPKAGKSSIAAALPNALHLVLDPKGTDFLSTMSVEVKSLDDIIEVNKAIKVSDHKYDFVIVDTITELEEMCLGLAARKYKNTVQGKNWKGSDVRELPSGSGYLFFRKAFMEVVEVVSTFAPKIIMLGHLKEKIVDKKGSEISVAEIDLTGKNKNLLSAHSDAIGYFFRKGNEGFMSFDNGADDVICGSRVARLAGKVIPISEKQEDDFVTVDWTEIYSFLKT